MRLLAKILLAAALPLSAWGQAFPAAKPIRIVVPFTAGGNVDLTARIISVPLGEILGQSVVVDNRPGAGGTIGADMVAKAAPDGYTLLMGSNSSLTVAPALYPKAPYSTARDFAPISLVAATPFVLVVNPAVPARTMDEFIALAKAQPGTLTMASGGNGSSNQLVGELFQRATGTKLVHVPYRGTAAATGDLLGGQVQLLFDQLPSSTGQMRAGKLRALGVTSAQRSNAAPDVPTMVEAGVSGMDVINITGLLAPVATPRATLDMLHDALLKALARPEVLRRFAELGTDAIGGTPEQFANYIREDAEKWTKVIREGNIQAD
jgi:tripartite-type tricarboxylate transporter receptor subunit TctC